MTTIPITAPTDLTDPTFLLFLIPALTSIIAYLVIRVVGVLPKAVIVPVVLPVLGLAVNWVLLLAGMPSVDPMLAAVLGSTAAALQKAIEHIGGLVSAMKSDGYITDGITSVPTASRSVPLANSKWELK